MSKKKIFIGAAWPYANGSLHLGHASALYGADVLARYFRLKGDDVLFVSGSDCHGTPIAVEAAERGIKPSEIADRYHEEFKKNLIDGLKFSYDLYTRTNTDQHIRVVQELFLDLYKKGFLYTRVEKALYSPLLGRFLPDRFVEGTCSKCGYDGARGDQCDECGSLLEPIELVNPKINPKILKQRGSLTEQDCRLEVRESEQFYLKLSALEESLKDWTEKTSKPWRKNARSFTNGFLENGLHDRAITRDTDWGVPIPLPGYEDKRIYVWFEAVTGYLSASKLWAENKGNPESWREWWCNDDAVHYYVHGKDNIPFHTIIWPALLLAEGSLHKPDCIVSSEYLDLEGKQFSKSRGWAVWLPDFLDKFDSETLRYFLVMNGPEKSDSNFVWAEYAQKVNGELIGTFGNLVNRVLLLSQKHFPEGARFIVPLDDESERILQLTKDAFSEVGKLIEKAQFRTAFKIILDIAENANRFIHDKAPWERIKDKAGRDQVETDLAVLVQIIRALSILINPFLPESSRKIFGFFGIDFNSICWEYPDIKSIKISSVSTLYKKIEKVDVDVEVAKLGNKAL